MHTYWTLYFIRLLKVKLKKKLKNDTRGEIILSYLSGKLSTKAKVFSIRNKFIFLRLWEYIAVVYYYPKRHPRHFIILNRIPNNPKTLTSSYCCCYSSCHCSLYVSESSRLTHLNAVSLHNRCWAVVVGFFFLLFIIIYKSSCGALCESQIFSDSLNSEQAGLQ